jgi:hypothetical protein
VVKLQEDVRATRANLKVVQSNLEMEKLKSAKGEQDAFTAQYQLVGSQEEHQKALERIKVLEEERDALKTALKEEEVARIAAEGLIALPQPKDGDDEDLILMQSPSRSPVKSPRKLMVVAHGADDSEKENLSPPKKSLVQMKTLQQELSIERQLRKRALDQIDFMKMECQFQCCSCRVAEQHGKKYIHDDSYLSDMERIKREVPIPAEDTMEVDVNVVVVVHEPDNMDLGSPMDQGKLCSTPSVKSTHASAVEKQAARVIASTPEPTLQPEMQSISKRHSSLRPSISIQHSTPEAEDTQTILHISSSRDEPFPQPAISASAVVFLNEEEKEEEEEEDDNDHDEDDDYENSDPVPNEPTSPGPITPVYIRTITTTTTIPMQFSPVKASTAPPMTVTGGCYTPSTPATISHPPTFGVTNNDENMPPQSPFPSGVFKADGTLDRAAALEMIRQRRGRAQSMVLGRTASAKQRVELTTGVRRDISAPQPREKVVAGGTWKQ